MQWKDEQLNAELGRGRRSTLLRIAVPGGIPLLVILLCVFLTSCGQQEELPDGAESEQTEIVLGEAVDTSSDSSERSADEQEREIEAVETIPSEESSVSPELSAVEETSTSAEVSTGEETGQAQETDREPADPYASLNFYDVEEEVTAKEATNLRDIPSQGEDSTVITVLQNGEVAQRIAISDAGWSKLIYGGNEYYAVSSLLTMDLDYHVVAEVDDGIQTVFTPCEDKVSPKIAVNLRRLPSVTHEDATVVVTLPYGEVVTRTGINADVGWSRVEYNGEVLYCISSYIYVVE